MIEVTVNEISQDGMHRVRVMSDVAPVPYPIQDGASVKQWDDAVLGLHYLEMVYPCREVVTVTLEGMPKPRKLVVYKLMPGERVSEIIEYVSDWYFISAHRRPQYAFLRKLPKGVENGVEVHGCILLEAEWALTGCVMIGG